MEPFDPDDPRHPAPRPGQPYGPPQPGQAPAVPPAWTGAAPPAGWPGQPGQWPPPNQAAAVPPPPGPATGGPPQGWPGQPQWPGQPGQPPPGTGVGWPGGEPVPPGRPRRGARPVVIGAVVGAVLLLGVGVAVLAQRSGNDPQPAAGSSGQPSGTPTTAPGQGGTPDWGVGACVRMVSGPTDAQLARIKDRQFRDQLAAARRYAPVDCADGQAVAKITKLGGTTGSNGRVVDSGCPPDTDLLLGKTTLRTAGSQIYCARNLAGPHPGDPGNGGGDLMAGDCVVVSSSNGVRVTNDEIYDVPCDSGYYAKVLATGATTAACPAAQTLSRLRVPNRPGVLLCLGRGEHGLIAKPGECINRPSNTYYSPTAAACTGPIPFRLVALVDTPAQCPRGTHGGPATGYDRTLCIRYPDGS